MTAIAEATDDGLMEQLITRDGNALAAAIRARRLHKRALDLPASDVPERAEPWVAEDPALVERVEDALAREVGLAPGNCCSTSRRARRCWAWICRFALGVARSSG